VATLNTDLSNKDIKRWENLGGPTPEDYKPTGDSAKIKSESKKVRVKEKQGFSDWRSEGFFEAITTPITDKKDLKKIKEVSGINNKVEINPRLKEAVAEMGGELLEVADTAEKEAAEDPGLKSKEQRQKMIKKQVLLKKLQAVRAGSHQDITASYEPEIKGKAIVGEASDAQLKAQEKAVFELEKKEANTNRAKAKKAREKEIDEEVGISSAAAMEKARKEAKLKAKEEAAVKKAKLKEAKVDTGSAEEKATARNLRNTPPGGNRKFDTSVFITRKPGESLDSARTRKRREAHAKKRGMKEDKAFDNVVAALRKKHGESGVLTKDSPKPKAQPRPKAKPDTRTPEQKKKDQDHANVMARYGGEANYKAGRGLGT
jgi:hypothetical protein